MLLSYRKSLRHGDSQGFQGGGGQKIISRRQGKGDRKQSPRYTTTSKALEENCRVLKVLILESESKPSDPEMIGHKKGIEIAALTPLASLNPDLKQKEERLDLTLLFILTLLLDSLGTTNFYLVGAQ